ncbi:DUF697 domain-containing protein [Flavilitoribacter nigricans]|uniref:DUF697 domain-containing protein n=1 Tax=Flavilitoribacter nigricans (strain ATCC 23147 / DSM 23189 / NBRC 102662 / NCIMB 1420 / SS-2) TaxID=1122177 RepID=A0A2D0N7I8_FLAN2|nr:DUF697 domain-containing protein [Flavilitoribacter nigricans]PHN04484.1 hypothetical protein CRP01_20970 [Flavilitoribacter nigricans DSM 23189 = NBRC 102662]
MSTATAETQVPESEVNTVFTEAKREADSVIKLHARLATAAALVPVTGVDVALVTAVQVRMVKQIAEAYDVPFDEDAVKVGVSSIIGATIARLVAYGAREAFNAFSQFGSLADNLTNAAISGFFTAATGEIYSMHFEGGGTLATLDVSDFIDYVSEQIRSGELHPRLFSSINSGFSHLY